MPQGPPVSFPYSQQPYTVRQPPMSSALPPPVYHPQSRESTSMRFLKALSVAVLVWLVFAVVSHGVVDLAGRRHGHGRHGHHHSPSDWAQLGCISASELVSTSEADETRNVRQPSHRAQALATYSLPVNASLVLSSQSRWSHSGDVYVYEDATLGREDQQTRVDVFVHAGSLSGLDSTEVCWWRGPFGENHIGVKVCDIAFLTAQAVIDLIDIDILML